MYIRKHLQVNLALDVESALTASLRKYYRKKREEVYPNLYKSMWHKYHDFLLPKDESEGNKKPKFDDLRAPLVS